MPKIPVSMLYRLLSFQWDYSIEITDMLVQINERGNVKKLPFSEITYKPKLVNGFLWDNIVCQRNGKKPFIISGVNNKGSDKWLSKIIHLIGQYHVKPFQGTYKQILSSCDKIKLVLNNKYARYSAVERWRQDNALLFQKINNHVTLDFLPENEKKLVNKFLNLFNKCNEVREAQNKKFIIHELSNYQEFFDKVESNPLTESQRLACVVNEDNNLILAGAGSGKTSVIIVKAGYLVQSGLAKPNEILILAYGRKASKETDERIKEKLPQIEGVTTSTFHKLGLDIIGQASGTKPRVSKLQEDTAECYKLINDIISKLTVSDKSYSQRIIDFFVTHLIPYKDQFAYDQKGDYFTSLKESNFHSIRSRIEYSQKIIGKKSLQQEQVKSFEEVVIADFLFVNGIKYKYEHPYEIHTATAYKTQYHPDFYLPEYGIYIEHFGINRDGKTPPFVDQISYTESMHWKRGLHREHNTTLVETFSYEMKEGILTDLLYSKLEKHGVNFKPLSFQELTQLLEKIGEERKATGFNKLVVTFLDLFKQSGFSIEDVRCKADKHHEKPRCHAFIDVFEPIFDKYSSELETSGTIDFSDMIRNATKFVQNGMYKPRYKYILVDEFQDISAIRAELVKSLVVHGDDAVLSCVGDDWQSIYRFSGSDINYTGNFEKHFGHTKRIPLDRTFRFNNKINEFATNFVTQNPAQIKKKVISQTSVSTNAITLVEYYQDVDNAIQHCVGDIRANHSEPTTIFMLGRYSFSKPAFLEKVGQQYPSYKFIFDTVHGSKGKEADYVIVVDVNEGRYGFPSKIVDEPLFDLVLPEAEPHENAEERRLFYVAITRAKHHSYILYDVDKPSVFINEIRDEKNVSKYHFNRISTEGVKLAPPDYGRCPSCGTGKILMRVMADGHFFFGCEHYPYCSYTPKTCEACNKYPLIKDGFYYRCQSPECGNVTKACRKCADGVMIERYGKYGKFFGCSNYGKTKCQYTEKISH